MGYFIDQTGFVGKRIQTEHGTGTIASETRDNVTIILDEGVRILVVAKKDLEPA